MKNGDPTFSILGIRDAASGQDRGPTEAGFHAVQEGVTKHGVDISVKTGRESVLMPAGGDDKIGRVRGARDLDPFEHAAEFAS